MRNDGGPAFPRYGNDEKRVASALCQDGMSLRDYFAGQALNAIAPHAGEERTDEELADVYARQAYLLADAMLAERAKESEDA